MTILQKMLDAYLALEHLRTVKDLEFIESENVIVVTRTRGHRGTIIDVSETASPSEAFDIVIHHMAVY